MQRFNKMIINSMHMFIDQRSIRVMICFITRARARISSSGQRFITTRAICSSMTMLDLTINRRKQVRLSDYETCAQVPSVCSDSRADYRSLDRRSRGSRRKRYYRDHRVLLYGQLRGLRPHRPRF